MPTFYESDGVVRRLFGDLSKSSVATQLVVGCVTGWCSGFLFITVGKAASLVVGVGLIFLQVAHH
jgi:FUN14 domain-containing protein 2